MDTPVLPTESPYFSDGYLDRCQVATPDPLVNWVWEQVLHFRPEGIAQVLDLGAGDGRFSLAGHYEEYTGVEIDARKIPNVAPNGATFVHGCALTSPLSEYCASIGNPPFVRHHDLNDTWRELVISQLEPALHVKVDRRSNAYLLFLAKALLATKADGLVAQIVPFEWVTRPSARWLRHHIAENKWAVHAYRLPNGTFDRVLTTASLTLIDKRAQQPSWNYYRVDEDLNITRSRTPSGTPKRVVSYSPRVSELYAQRGLSPGTQKVFCLTETERQRHGLNVDRDVVPCVTTLQPLNHNEHILHDALFYSRYVDGGRRCWLIRSDQREHSTALSRYLEQVPEEHWQTHTCLSRAVWYQYRTPPIPDAIFSLGFIKHGPKFLLNNIGARPVGAVAGIHADKNLNVEDILISLRAKLLTSRLVAHSNTLKKIEINQLNRLLQNYLAGSK